MLVNENVTGIPSINPFQELYYKQFGGSPTPEALRRMDPKKADALGEANSPGAKRKANANAHRLDDAAGHGFAHHLIISEPGMKAAGQKTDALVFSSVGILR